MRQVVIVGVIQALLLAAMPVQADPVEVQAIAAARGIALRQVGDTTYQRSQLRTWTGLGIIGAGLILAFSGKKCGTTGSLGPGYMNTNPFGFVSMSGSNLKPLMGAAGECLIELTLTSTVNVGGQVSSESGPLRLPRRSGLDAIVLSAGGNVPAPEVRETIVESILGSAAALESRSPGRMVAGLGVAAAGVLLATVFANAPVAVTRLDRSGVALGSGLSW